MEGLTEGRIVRYVLQPPEATPADVLLERSAIITKVWNEQGFVNLLVLGEGPYDQPSDPRLASAGSVAGIFWATSISFSETAQPQTWHWTPRA